jgi:hypothetical protein
MPTINISELGDAVVIYFDTAGERINAYTLASTLVGIADAAKAANSAINAGYDIEVVVEALGPGSFRAMLRALYTQAGNLFSAESLRSIVLGVIVTFIYERACGVDPVRVQIQTDEVIIESGSNKVIVPRKVYQGTRSAEQNPQFVRSIVKTFEAIGADDAVNGIGVAPRMDSPRPDFIIPQNTIRDIDLQPGVVS